MESADVQVVVVRGKRATFFGRDSLREIRLNWGSIMKAGSTELEHTVNLYSNVSEKNLVNSR